METYQLLKSLASGHDAKRLCDVLSKTSKSDISVSGLTGSAASLLFSSYLSTIKAGNHTQPLLFILNDEEEAGYFYHDMIQMLDDETIHFFPSSYRRAIKYNQKDAANEILRTNVLSDKNKNCIVTYPEALAEKVVSKQDLTSNTIELEVGKNYDVTLLENRLFELGFNRTDYVYEPGQFAIRGSIVDIYSFSNDEPYRIDFFGDEIESIRIFDIQTQLSDRKVTSIAIVPKFDSSEIKCISLIEFISKDTIIIAKDLQFVTDRIDMAHQEGFSRQALMSEPFLDNQQPRADFISSGEEFMNSIKHHRKIFLRTHSNGTSFNERSIINIEFSTINQPLFHKNFEMLTNEFEKLISEGYHINIFADNEHQIHRLEDIFDANRKGEMLITFTAVNKAIHEGYIDKNNKQCYFTDHQIFDRYHKYNLKSDKARRGKVALSLKEIQQFEIGDYVVHIDHGVGRFGGLVRVPSTDSNGNTQYKEMIKITYQNDDIVYVSIHALNKVAKYKGREGEAPRLNKLGTGAWEHLKERVKNKVKDIARDLIRLYSQRMKEQGYAYSPDSYLQEELEASFIYEDTPDQLKATNDIKADMERQHPMDRLVCGDVGFGKTEVAIRAAFKAAVDGKQVAVLVPTTILAYQHYKTFSNRLHDFAVNIDYISRARTAKDTKEILEKLASGKIDIIIGTHKLIGKGIKFHDLGLLIIDEEQKFGVSVKEKLRQMKVNVDTLTMTATPIPRTFQFSLMGARDLSIIQTPPANRYPIQTEIHTFSPEIIAEAINFEMSRNGQVFFVNNRINNLLELKAVIERQVPDARVVIGHGQMSPKELEQIVYDFMNHDYDVLLSTTIVENGVDIPNANTIIINSAHMYGLSDLHQMRGRVGRGNKKAFCYLIAPPLSALPDNSRRRLQALENFSELGSGIQIAMQDLDIRGAGNLLGAEQSGFITDLGYETYQKILAEAMTELQHDNTIKDETKENNGNINTISNTSWIDTTSFTLESDLAAYFPEEYVPNSGERIELYRELDSLTNQEALEQYKIRLKDRFGTPPLFAEELMRVMPLKWLATELGLERITLKGKNMILYFVSDFNSTYYQSETFSKIIYYASRHPRQAKLRESTKRSLIIKDITNMSQALEILNAIKTTTF